MSHINWMELDAFIAWFQLHQYTIKHYYNCQYCTMH